MEEAPEQPRFNFFSLTFLIGFGGGIFIGVALSLAAFAMVRDTEPDDTLAFATATPLPGTTPQATPDTRVRTLSAQEVRLGPGDAFAILGTIARGEAVDVLGRNADGDWVAVRFPPGSTAQGWLPVGSLTEVSELSSLAVVLPTPISRSLPTPPASTGGSSGLDGVPQLPGVTPVVPSTPVPGVTVQPAGPPDLAVLRIVALDDGRISVTIGNRGTGPVVDRAIFVIVSDGGMGSETLRASANNLAAGATTTLVTSGLLVTQDQSFTAIVDPSQSISDSDRSNNVLSQMLQPPQPVNGSPTPDF